MGLHNIGFYDKNNLDNQVVLIRDGNIFNYRNMKMESEIIDFINEIAGVPFNEYHYELLCNILKKYYIPKGKIKETRKIIGCSLRYGILD